MQYSQEGYSDARIVPGGYPIGQPYIYRILPDLRRLTESQPKRYKVNGRFGLKSNPEVRGRAIELLSREADLGFVGGARMVRQSRYLRDMARSEIGIDLPGNGDFCFRLVHLLSIGVCVVGLRPRTEFPVPLIDREHIVFCKEDMSDLVSLCRYYLEHDDERRRIARNAREYFDRSLHRDQLAGYYLSRFLASVA